MPNYEIRNLLKFSQIYFGQYLVSFKQHRGRVVDSPGDNILAEFASVVDATECAVEVQQELKNKNAELPDEFTVLASSQTIKFCPAHADNFWTHVT